MSDVTYGVSIEYLSSGSLNLPGGTSGLDKANAAMKTLVSGTKSFADGLDKAVNGIALAGLGTIAAGALAMFKVGIIGVNSELEQFSIGMAAMFSAHGNVDTFNEGLTTTKFLIEKMRDDARDLPGEFKDLTKIMSTMTTPSLNAGLSIRETEKMAANAMSSGITHGIHPDVIGREMGAIISGNARSNMPMLTRGMLNLKVDAKELNKMSVEKRVATVQKALGMRGGPEQEAMEQMKNAHRNSWVGLTSTAIDNAKRVLGVMTAPLFERMKGAFSFVNKWYDNNSQRIASWAETVGYNLAKGFTWAFHQLAALEPVLMKLGSVLNKEINHGKISRDIGMALGTGAALKMGAAVLPGAISGVGSLMAPGATAVGGAGGGGLLGAAGLGIVETGGALAIVLAAIAVAMVAVYGAFEGLGNTLSPLNSTMVKLWQTAKFYFADAIESIGRSFEIVEPVLRRIAEFLGGALIAGLEIAAETFNKLAHAIESMLTKIANSPLVKAAFASMAEFSPLLAPDAKKYGDRPDRERPLPADLDRKMPVAKPPTHSTTIHKIEIKVNSNQDPNRIARTVHGLLLNEARNPRSARINPAAQFNTQ